MLFRQADPSRIHQDELKVCLRDCPDPRDIVHTKIIDNYKSRNQILTSDNKQDGLHGIYPIAIPMRSSIDMKMSCISYFHSGKKECHYFCMLAYLAHGSILVLPMSEKIYPSHLVGVESAKDFLLHFSQHTATVPKIAPLAPREGDRTSPK